MFNDEKKSRTEDRIIAYTWVKYLKTGDEAWPLHISMTNTPETMFSINRTAVADSSSNPLQGI